MDMKAATAPSAAHTGRGLHEFAARLYPICRSITGNGVRRTLALIGERVPLAAAFPLAIDRPPLAFAVLVVAAATDVLDGWYARAHGQTTATGAAAAGWPWPGR